MQMILHLHTAMVRLIVYGIAAGMLLAGTGVPADEPVWLQPLSKRLTPAPSAPFGAPRARTIDCDMTPHLGEQRLCHTNTLVWQSILEQHIHTPTATDAPSLTPSAPASSNVPAVSAAPPDPTAPISGHMLDHLAQVASPRNSPKISSDMMKQLAVTSTSVYVGSNLMTLDRAKALVLGATGEEAFAEKVAPTLLRIVRSMPWRGGVGVVAAAAGAVVVYQWWNDEGSKAPEQQYKPIAAFTPQQTGGIAAYSLLGQYESSPLEPGSRAARLLDQIGKPRPFPPLPPPVR
jgi:hypothetical protein